jgi:hypothetical protein
MVLVDSDGNKWEFPDLKSTYFYGDDTANNTFLVEPEIPLKILLVDRLESPTLKRTDKKKNDEKLPGTLRFKVGFSSQLTGKDLKKTSERIYVVGEGVVRVNWKDSKIPDNIDTKIVGESGKK